MTRKTAREIAVQLCFASASSSLDIETLLNCFFDSDYYQSLKDEDPLFNDYPDDGQMDYIRRLLSLQADNRFAIDGYIEKYSKDWRVERISKTALAVLRCAVCEILYMEDIPNAAAINEAVELDKGYDEPDTVAFVNGVLGGIVRGEIVDKNEDEHTVETEADAVTGESMKLASDAD